MTPAGTNPIEGVHTSSRPPDHGGEDEEDDQGDVDAEDDQGGEDDEDDQGDEDDEDAQGDEDNLLLIADADGDVDDFDVSLLMDEDS